MSLGNENWVCVYIGICVYCVYFCMQIDIIMEKKRKRENIFGSNVKFIGIRKNKIKCTKHARKWIYCIKGIFEKRLLKVLLKMVIKL